MRLVPNSWGSKLREYNQCHNPAGHPEGGGRFCAKKGGGLGKDAFIPAPKEPAPRGTWTRPYDPKTKSGEYEVRLSESKSVRMLFREEWKESKYKQPQKDRQVTPDEISLEVETRAAKAAFDAARDFWASNDPDARWIKRQDGDATNPLPDRKIGAMLVMTLDSADYGAGSGGPGTAKVFWGPYSAPNRRERLKTENDRNSRFDSSYADSLGVDPIYVLVHELHHAYGNHSELDLGSDTVALDAHLKLGLKEPAAVTAVRRELANKVAVVRFHKPGSRYYNRAAFPLRYLHKRNPTALKNFIVKHDILSAEEWDKTLQKILRPRKSAKVSEAASAAPRQKKIAKCLNAKGRKMRESQGDLRRDYGIERFEYPTPYSKIKHIGFAPKTQTWYGWSHRAIAGFKVGSVVRKGDVIAQGTAQNRDRGAPGPFPVGFRARTLEDARRMAARFAVEVS